MSKNLGSDASSELNSHGFQFPTTMNGALAELHSSDEAVSLGALESLFSAYLPVVNSYFGAHSGANQTLTKDLAQGFCEHVIRDKVLQRYIAQPGIRFRHFLSRCLHNFLCDSQRSQSTLKAQARDQALSLDCLQHSSGWEMQVSQSADDLESLLDLPLARHLHTRTIQELSQRYEKSQKLEHFRYLEGKLLDVDAGLSYGEIGDYLGVSAAAIKQEKYRLSQAYYQTYRAFVSELTPEPDVSEETRYLIALLPRFGSVR